MAILIVSGEIFWQARPKATLSRFWHLFNQVVAMVVNDPVRVIEA
jgi:hypothetical protein